MEIVDHIYYGFGKIVLAAITVDGKVDKSEVESLQRHLDKAKKYHNGTSEELLKSGIHDFHLGDAHLTPEMASTFRSILIDVVSAEPPITGEEEKLVKDFITYLNERERAAN